MGLISGIFGMGPAVSQVGQAVGGMAEVFAGNRAEREAAEARQTLAALSQFGVEFQQPAQGPFDRFMNALNRLPRPLLVIGTLGLFAYSMVEPEGFAHRMRGLDLVPDPLWWLLGAIVSFYFGARELHYQRGRLPGPTVVPVSLPLISAPETDSAPPQPGPAPDSVLRPRPRPAAPSPTPTVTVRAADPKFNAAIEEWRAKRN